MLVCKGLLTSLCASTGLVGGTFAPSLFLGAAAGTALGGILASLAARAALVAQAVPPLAPVAFAFASFARAGGGGAAALSVVGAAATLAAVFRSDRPLLKCVVYVPRWVCLVYPCFFKSMHMFLYFLFLTTCCVTPGLQ